jgi:X-X-X-Leu-X-X-Gly heptad repeat protein
MERFFKGIFVGLLAVVASIACAMFLLLCTHTSADALSAYADEHDDSENYIAEVAGIKYESIDDALKNVTPTNGVKLLKCATACINTYAVSVDFTLDLNGHTLTAPVGQSAIVIANGSTLSITSTGSKGTVAEGGKTDYLIANDGTLSLYKGVKFVASKADLLLSESKVVYNGATALKTLGLGRYEVVDAVAQYTASSTSLPIYTATLQEAVTRVADKGYSISLLRDTHENIVVAKSGVVTIDLNGYKLTNDEIAVTLTNNGNLTLEGEGVVDNVSGNYAFVNNGTATLNGGTFTMSAGSDTLSDGDGGYIINNQGSLTITGNQTDDHLQEIEALNEKIEELSDMIDALEGNVKMAMSDDATKVISAQDSAVDQMRIWMDEYLRELLGIGTTDDTNNAITLSAVIDSEDEVSADEIEVMIDKAFNKRNAALVRKYYDDAKVAVSNATTVDDVTSAVAVFKAQVTTIELMQETETDNTGLYALMVIAVILSVAALLVAVLMWKKRESGHALPHAAEAMSRPMEVTKTEVGESKEKDHRPMKEFFVNPFDGIRADLERQLNEGDESGKVVAIRRETQWKEGRDSDTSADEIKKGGNCSNG